MHKKGKYLLNKKINILMKKKSKIEGRKISTQQPVL
jgi:hypothetical protein